MWRSLRIIIDAVIPPHRAVERALKVSHEALAGLVEPKTLPRAAWIHVLFPYRDPRVRALIHAAKYYGSFEAVEKLAPHAADYALELVEELHALEGWQHILIVPIPSSPARLRKRGYNQAARLGKAVAARITEAKYDESILKREDRESQVHVARSKRKENISNAFKAEPRAAGTFVLLIDDVVESGATLQDARRALLASGAKGVVALAIAH